jgi:hypothetical protein
MGDLPRNGGPTMRLQPTLEAPTRTIFEHAAERGLGAQT